MRADGWRVPPPTARRAVEHLGVRIVCRGRLRELLTDVRPAGARITEASFSTQPPLRVVTCVAPHAGRADGEKDAFYQQLRDCIQRGRQSEVLLVGGDFNARVEFEQGPQERHIGKGTLPRPGRGADREDEEEGAEGGHENERAQGGEAQEGGLTRRAEKGTRSRSVTTRAGSWIS